MHGLSHQDDTADVDVVDVFVVLLGDVGERSCDLNGGVVDQDVDMWAEGFERGVYNVLVCRSTSQVCADADCC